MTDQPTADPVGDTIPETARALLWRHGLPEDAIDGALALFAQELAGKIRAHRDHTRGAVQATKVMDFAADLISPEHWARTVPAVPVSSPPPDQTALREAIDGALHRVLDSNLGKGTWTRLRAKATDAVLAVLPPPADQAAICRGLADQQTQLAVADDLARRRDMAAARRQLVKELLRLAAEAQQPATDTEHTPEPAQEA